jgi:uncharacterized membrane protein
MKKLIFIWEELKTSFWFIPILLILTAIGIAVGTIYVDNEFDFDPTGRIVYLFTGSADSARSVLSVISGAMIGVAGTVFSITLVALTLASSQFGPRLLRNFMHERINQVVLGTYISTYVYCLMVLNVIKDNDEIEFIPIFSVFLAILAAVANIILLIVFIHHISVSIQADKVISEISAALSKNINQLFSEERGEDNTPRKDPDLIKLKKSYKYHQSITSPKSGYLQYIDIEIIMNVAKENMGLAILQFQPGDHVVEGIVLIENYAEEPLRKEDLQKLQKAFMIGKVRTPQQDAEYSIHQMVEVASRALSPGVNDPFTAIACIDNLTATMCQLTKVKFPSAYLYDEHGKLREVLKTLTFEVMLNASFNQIRQFAKGSPSVVIRLMEAMITINKLAKTGKQKKAIQKHAKMILRMAEDSFEEKNDLDDLKKRSVLIVENA